jgi:hypothetical protein
MVRKNSGSMSQRSVGGEGAAASVSSGGSGSEVSAAVEALVAALPLRLSTQVLRTSSQERRGERRCCCCYFKIQVRHTLAASQGRCCCC